MIVFRRHDALSLHFKTVHRGVFPFPCSHCTKSFKTKRNLSLHERAAHMDKVGLKPKGPVD